MADKSDRRDSGATYAQFSQSPDTLFWRTNVLPYCDQSDSDADATLHGGPTQQRTYPDGPPEHQTSHQIQRHSLQQYLSV